MNVEVMNFDAMTSKEQVVNMARAQWLRGTEGSMQKPETDAMQSWGQGRKKESAVICFTPLDFYRQFVALFRIIRSLQEAFWRKNRRRKSDQISN